MNDRPSAEPHAPRRRWMAILARASAADIEARLVQVPPLPEYRFLRRPETGLVMLRGRAGGDGAGFNCGELPVTRCSVHTASGLVGHAYVTGRDPRQAELAAVLDAVLQDPERAGSVQQEVIAPLAEAQQARRDTIARKAAATRVQFFTMATMR